MSDFPSKDFLSPTGFRFECPFLPSISSFVQKVIVPGIGIGVTKTPNPFVPMNVAGDQQEFYTLSIEFKIDEDLQNWKEIYDWVKAIGFDTDFDQRKSWLSEYGSTKSEAVVTVLNAHYNSIGKFVYEDISPTFISGFTLQTDVDGINYVSAQADFSYTKWRFEPLN